MKWYFGAVVLLAMALAFDMGLLAYAMYALLGVMIVSQLLSRAWSESLSATRQCNRLSGNVGDTVAVVVTVKNNRSLPIAWMLLEDMLPRRALIHNPPNLKIDGHRVQLTMLPGNGRKTMFYQLKCNRRGYYQLGPLVVETGDLFGLHRRYRVLTEPQFLLIYPQVIALEEFEIASRKPLGEIRMSHRLFEDPTRIAGVRQYQNGDPLNRVHWQATARTGRLHSKIYEPSCIAGATLLLDFHQDSYERRHEPFRSELAITAAASLADAVYRQGQQVGLVTNARDAADRIRQEGWQGDHRTRSHARRAANMEEESSRLQPQLVLTQRGPEQFMRILETLARAELTDGLDLPQLIVESVSRLPRDASVIVLTSRVDTSTAIALGDLHRRGFAVTVIINIYDEYEYSEAAGLLMAQGVEARHLKSEDGIPDLCRRSILASHGT